MGGTAQCAFFFWFMDFLPVILHNETQLKRKFSEAVQISCTNQDVF